MAGCHPLESMGDRYLICLETRGISLTAGKRYKVIPDKKWEARGWVRVIDDTEADYYFPGTLFEAEAEVAPEGEHVREE